MSTPIENIKKTISNKYLGKEGIHGVGISRSKQTVRIYFEQSNSLQQKQILEKIKKEADPFIVVTIEGKKPSVM